MPGGFATNYSIIAHVSHPNALMNDITNLGLRLFSVFDRLVELHCIMKVETVGDCYIAAGGMFETGADGFYQVTRGWDYLLLGCRV